MVVSQVAVEFNSDSGSSNVIHVGENFVKYNPPEQGSQYEHMNMF